MRSTHEARIEDGRLMQGGKRGPLHVRIELDNGAVTKVTLGHEKDGRPAWTLALSSVGTEQLVALLKNVVDERGKEQ